VPLTKFVEFSFGKMLAGFAHEKQAVVELARLIHRVAMNGWRM
jgi:hypothetical protein